MDKSQSNPIAMKKVILLFCFGLIGLSLFGQVRIPYRSTTLSGGFQVAVPQGEFAENYKGLPYGVNASISIPIQNLPIEYGGGFSWNQIAAEGRDVVLESDRGLVPANLDVNGNAYSYHVHARLRPFNGDFRPYGEFLVGMRTYGIKSKLSFEDSGEAFGDPTTSVSNRDFTWISGWAVGVQYRLISGLFLEGRFEKLKGDQAQYINPQSLRIEPDGDFQYDMNESRTDQFTISLGVAFNF